MRKVLSCPLATDSSYFFICLLLCKTIWEMKFLFVFGKQKISLRSNRKSVCIEIYGIRVVYATFGIHSQSHCIGHCCKFHLILCHILCSPHMHLTFSHLTCKIFNTQSFPFGPTKSRFRSRSLTGPRQSDRPKCWPQRVKCKYSKLFLKCAQCLSVCRSVSFSMFLSRFV